MTTAADLLSQHHAAAREKAERERIEQAPRCVPRDEIRESWCGFEWYVQSPAHRGGPRVHTCGPRCDALARARKRRPRHVCICGRTHRLEARERAPGPTQGDLEGWL